MDSKLAKTRKEGVACLLTLPITIASLEVMSTNFDLVAVGYTDTFDSHLMQDAFADYSTSRGSVLLTSEFGVRCTTKKGGVAGMSVVADGKTDDGIERRLLLRPRIVLESVLDVLDPK